ENSAGIANKDDSTLRLDLAYPAFPSQQDTAHTLLGALKNLEGKFHGHGIPTFEEAAPWLGCVASRFVEGTAEGRRLFREKAKARGVVMPEDVHDTAGVLRFARSLPKEKRSAILVDVLR